MRGRYNRSHERTCYPRAHFPGRRLRLLLCRVSRLARQMVSNPDRWDKGAKNLGSDSIMDDFQKRGHVLIDELKEHVLTTFSRDPRGSSNGPGLATIDIERLSGLGIQLDRASERKQEHWITWTILQRLVADGLVMPIYSDKTRYRRRSA